MTVATLTHGEMVKHIRARLHKAGLSVRASVRKQTICGFDIVNVSTAKYGDFFTPEDCRRIKHVCQCNRLTGSHGAPLNLDAPFQSFDFVMPYHSE